MKKSVTLTLLAMIVSFASFALGPISPSSGTVCIGVTMALADSLHPGGTWSSSSTGIATVGSSSGVVTGVSSGVVTITYTLGSSFVTGTYTVSPGPSAITGSTSSICVGSSVTLSSTPSGGTWSTSSSYVATVGSSSGVVTGAHVGWATIFYSVGSCWVSRSVTVTSSSVGGIIVGPTTVCAGGTMTLTDSAGLSGTWSSSNPSVATVGASTGVVTGVSTGTVVISYTTTGTCGTSVVTRTITVTTGTTTPGSIGGPSSVMAGSTITLTNSVPGGTWTSSSTGTATVGASTGVVTGVAAGTVTITYTVTGCSGPASVTTVVTVTPFDGISGDVLFGSGPHYGNIKVWLITFDPSTNDLQASDSIYSYVSGSSFYYQFTGVPTDSYRIKAAVVDTFWLTTGYIPTYHTSNSYWSAANVVYHTSGTADINKDINMGVGTPTTGPGFIAGDVTTGANKGTATGAPAVNMLVFVLNSAGAVIQQTYTDAAGHYSFSNLPVGQTYTIYPEAINFATTAYASITLTAAAPSMNVADFTQHLLSKTITPHTSAVNTIKTSGSSIAAFPNPANNKLNIQWEAATTETATVTISDITGRNVYAATINMTVGTGVKQIDLSGYTNGIYTISVSSASVNYTNKIQVQH